MTLSFGTLELQRNHPAHLGTQPLMQAVSPVTRESGAQEKSVLAAGKNRGMFETYLLEAVNGVNGQQMDVAALQERVVTDPDSVDIHDVTVAMAKARQSLDLAYNVINRLVSGWQELSQNR
ncbi:MAG: flagellar hook-basal body complex protein FliE [Treponema sp.]|nr:flagellar hook-basal body complex protein FliE [Treponema sp.]